MKRLLTITVLIAIFIAGLIARITYKVLLCRMGVHRWRVNVYSFNHSGNKRNQKYEWNYYRECDHCEKQQDLQPTKDYSAGEYVWTNSSIWDN